MQELGRNPSVAGLSSGGSDSLPPERSRSEVLGAAPVYVSGEMGRSADPTEPSLQGDGHQDLETGAETGTGGNHPQEQFPLTAQFCSNGDARGARDPGYPSPSSNPPGRKALICVSGVAAVLIIALVVLAVEKYKAPVVAQRVGCVAACPGDDWLAFQGKCYYFSEAEGNWSSSQTHCSALGASLAGIDSEQEMDFMLRYGGPRDHWIGLWNEMGPHWRWVNGSEFNSWFPIGGGGQCVYLKEADTVSSSRCSLERHWICSKHQM